MAAFNYILLEAQCPHCGQQTIQKAQTHIASDFDGDSRGRFVEQEYRLGERMRWFLPEADGFADWMTWGKSPDGRVREVCASKCERCGAKVYAVIEFIDVTPVDVLEVGPVANWAAAVARWER